MLKCNALTNGITLMPDGKIMPCCQFEETYAEEFTPGKERFAKIKQSFDQGVQHPACHACWNKEKVNVPSYRDFHNKEFDPIDSNDTSIHFLDLRNSNLCNLACRMCSPFYSSTIARIKGVTPSIVHSDLSKYLDALDISKLQHVYFAGGEPFLNGDHWLLLNCIENPEKVQLTYSSNLTTLHYKDKHIFDYWPKFSKIKFLSSLDGGSATNELIRVGSSWETIESNLDKILEYNKQHHNLKLCVLISVSMLNIWDLENLVNFLLEKHITEICLAYVRVPAFLALSTLPEHQKQHALEILDKIHNIVPETTTKEHIKYISTCLNSTDTSHLLNDAVDAIKDSDRRHKIDLFGKIKGNLL